MRVSMNVVHTNWHSTVSYSILKHQNASSDITDEKKGAYVDITFLFKGTHITTPLIMARGLG